MTNKNHHIKEFCIGEFWTMGTVIETKKITRFYLLIFNNRNVNELLILQKHISRKYVALGFYKVSNKTKINEILKSLLDPSQIFRTAL